jgi:hypothetical protein
MDDCKPLRPRSGAGPRCRHRRRLGCGFSARRSHACRRAPIGPGPDTSEMVSPDHFRKVGTPPSGGIVDLAPRVLPLSLKLPFLLSRTTPFSVPPDHRILSLIRGHRRPSGAFRTDRSIRDDPSLFPIPVATPEPCSGLFCSSKTAGRWITTLARSSNFRSLTDCVRPRGPKPRSLGRHSASQLVSTVRTTSLVASRTAAAHRLTSWLLSRRDTTPSEEAGDMCLKGGPHSE